MRKRIAKFFIAIPLTAGFVFNPNISEGKVNKQTSSLNKYKTLLVYDKQPSQDKVKIVVTEETNANQEQNEISVVEDNSFTEKANKNGVTEGQLARMEKMVAGYPIAKMLPYIAKRDSVTAAFLVSIAKKESNLGKVSPRTKDGDC